jgi:GntR family histidine utilization transcriptional repressor
MLNSRENHKPMPLYERIKTYVTDRIANGTWKSGDKVPSEHELAAMLGASRLTVHRAFRELAAAGILNRLHGVGTFVAPQKPVSTIVRLHNIADEIRERGDRFSARVHRLARVRADEELAARFEIAPGDELFHSIIVYSANDVPVQLEDRYVSPVFAPDFLKQDFVSRSTTDYLQAIAVATEALLVIEAQMPDAQTRRLLQISRSEPCLVVMRRTRVHDLVTTYTRFFHPGSRHRIASHYDVRMRHK